MKTAFTLFFFLIILATAFDARANLPPTTSQGAGDIAPVTTFKYNFDTIPLSHNGTEMIMGIIPLTQGGTGSATKNFVDLTTAQSVGGLKDFTNDVTSSDFKFNDPAYNTISTKQAISHQMATGVIDGAVLTINASPALFNISAQNLSFSDYSASSLNPTVKYVNCAAALGNVVTNIAVSDNTYILVSPACAIVQQTTFPTQIQRRTNAFIGRLVHPNHSTISTAATLPDLAFDTNSAMYDLFDAIGAFNVSGNVISPNGANLSINKSAGVTFRRSVGYPTTRQNPNTVAAAGAVIASVTRFTQTAQVVGPFTVLDVGNYDVGGVVTAIPGGGNVSTNSRIYLFGNGQIAVQYGQVTYSNLANAIAAISTESFVVNPTANDGGVLLAVVTCRKGATDASNPTHCTFQKAGRFDNSGASVGSLATTTLQQAYLNSVTPQIVTTTSQGSVDIQRGSAADTDKVLRVQNGAGTEIVSFSGIAMNEGSTTDAATTGTATVLTTPVSPIVRLTNASLVSIDTIPAPVNAGRVLTLANATGVSISLNNDTGATAANRILTGLGTSLVMRDTSSVVLKYDATSLRWRVISAPSAIGTVATFSGDDSTVAFALAYSPLVKENVSVFINGVYQQKSTYTLSGVTITFSEAPITGTNNIEVNF